MGHSSIVTTQRYLHSQAEEKKEAVETLVKKPQRFDNKRQKSVISSEGQVLTHSFLTG